MILCDSLVVLVPPSRLVLEGYTLANSGTHKGKTQTMSEPIAPASVLEDVEGVRKPILFEMLS